MKCTTIIDQNREEEVLIYLHQPNDLSKQIEALILEQAKDMIGYREGNILKIRLSDVICFLSESGKVYALTEDGKWQIRSRLYEIEETLGEDFVKINQSCIANIRKIKRFEATIGASLAVIFQNGYRDYVSRRQMKTVKERMGFKR